MDGMDPHDLGDGGVESHGLGDHTLDDHALDDHGVDDATLDPDGLDPAPDDPGQGWPDDVSGHDHLGADHADAELDTADTADLSFAEDYHHAYHDGGEHPLDGEHDLPTPIGYGDLSAHPPDYLHDLAGAEDAPFGADPDLHPLAATDLAQDPPFPPALDLDTPDPIDGYPWADPDVLGHDSLPPLDDTTGGPDPADLFEYAGEQPPAGDAWAALLASDDPATSTLARWWSGVAEERN
jgi:hypothetical protein